MPNTITVSNYQTFTAAQLLTLTEYAIAQILVGGQAVSASGRQLTKADLATLYKERDRLKEEVALNDAGDAGAGNVLVRFGEPQ